MVTEYTKIPSDYNARQRLRHVGVSGNVYRLEPLARTKDSYAFLFVCEPFRWKDGVPWISVEIELVGWQREEAVTSQVMKSFYSFVANDVSSNPYSTCKIDDLPFVTVIDEFGMLFKLGSMASTSDGYDFFMTAYHSAFPSHQTYCWRFSTTRRELVERGWTIEEYHHELKQLFVDKFHQSYYTAVENPESDINEGRWVGLACSWEDIPLSVL